MLLLDTHTVFWWWTNADKLSPLAYESISHSKNTVFLSSASIWELSTKYRKGKLPEAEAILQHLDWLIEQSAFQLLDINYKHAKLSGELPQNHADPFDRMLVAQAYLENLTLISKDKALQQFPIKLLW